MTPLSQEEEGIFKEAMTKTHNKEMGVIDLLSQAGIFNYQDTKLKMIIVLSPVHHVLPMTPCACAVLGSIMATNSSKSMRPSLF